MYLIGEEDYNENTSLLRVKNDNFIKTKVSIDRYNDLMNDSKPFIELETHLYTNIFNILNIIKIEDEKNLLDEYYKKYI